ncbi:MAG: TetR/AcrR family transcriptional regulator [Hyphomicrobiaceae bacterium]
MTEVQQVSDLPPRQALDTRTRILDTAEQLVRTRGYYGFSYADIADRIGISKPSIHHHFKTKEDLGKSLILTTRDKMEGELARAPDRSALGLLKRYVQFFEQSIEGKLICLCGMLIAEDDGLPEQLRATNRDFVDWQLDWIENLLAKGRDAGEINFEGAPRELASFIYSTVQGAHVLAKFQNDLPGFKRTMNQLLARLACAQT